MPKLSADQAQTAELSRDFPEREPELDDETGRPYDGPNAQWAEE